MWSVRRRIFGPSFRKFYSGSVPMIELAQKSGVVFDELCQQFHAATGWPFRFQALNNESVSDFESSLSGSGEFSWWKRIDDGANCLGIAIVQLPDQLPPGSTFDAVIRFAETIADMMCQLARSRRVTSEQARCLQSLAPRDLHRGSRESLIQRLNDLLTAATRTARCDSACLYLLNPARNRLNLRAATGLPRSHLPETSRSLVSSWGDLEALTRSLAIVEHRPDSPDSELPASMQTGIVFAIQTPTMPLGTLWLFDRSPRPVGAWELEPLRALAAQIALVLERVALLKESESHHRIQTELRVIADHLSLAPRVPLPETSGLEATFRSYSQHEVGGDLCDLISLSGDTTAIVVGDVSGNSIPAALVANAVKGALQPLLDGTDPLDTAPSAVMGRLNSALDTVGCGHQFVSLFYGIYDSATRRLRYSNAGHPSPILIRDGQVSALAVDGFLLGILTGVEYDCAEVQLEFGDLVVLYTDGISETHGQSGGLFGESGIIATMQAAEKQPVHDILNQIWKQAEAFAGTDPRRKSDDRSLMVLRVSERAP